MNRRALEHLVRATAAITQQSNLVVVGSQAALVQHAKLPAAMLQSPELDIYPRDAPELADLIDGAIGEGSPFHRQFGYYAQGVGPDTASFPAGWEDRAFRLRNRNTHGATAIAPELHDLCAAKLVAGRDKDLVYVDAAIEASLVGEDTLAERLGSIPALAPAIRDRAVRWLAGRRLRRQS